MRYPIFTLLSLLAVGCAAGPDKMNSLRVGMSKTAVEQAMGRPYSTAATGSIEVLRYRLAPHPLNPDYTEEYFVKLSAGSVESFGKIGDFNSTKDPTLNVNINR